MVLLTIASFTVIFFLVVSVSCWRLVLLTKEQGQSEMTVLCFRLLLEIGSSNDTLDMYSMLKMRFRLLLEIGSSNRLQYTDNAY